MKKRDGTASRERTESMGFGGFPEEGLRFLRQLKRNNDREWFRKRKAEYGQHVEEPMKTLVLAVAGGCRACGLPLYAKEKTPVMRVYRDIRFSRDKRPFKTHVAAELRRSFSDSSCVLYIHLSPDESLVAAGVWQPERSLLHAWREAIAGQPERFAKMRAALARRDLDLSLEHALSGMPRGFQQYALTPAAEYLKLMSFVVSRSLQLSDCTKPELLKVIVDFARAAKPLFEFAWQLENTMKTPAP